MTDELAKELRDEIRDLAKVVNQMVPKVDWSMHELEGINKELGFMRTIYGRHDADIETNKSDINAAHSKIDKINEDEKSHYAAERIHMAAEKARNGDHKWEGLVEFLMIALPKFAKRFGPWIVTVVSLLGTALMELLRHHK